MDTFEAITQRRAVKQFDPDHKMTYANNATTCTDTDQSFILSTFENE
jgi:hypothetical protein